MIRVKAGQQIAFLNGAMLIGSSLQPVVTILDTDLNVLRESGSTGGAGQLMFAHQFKKAGVYYIRIADYQRSGRASHTYRIVAGEFPLVTGAFPLGLRKDSTAAIALRGYHVAANLNVQAKLSPDSDDGLMLRPEHAFNQVRLAVGTEPEIQQQGGAIPVPITVNGRIAAPGAENRYRFQARKGEALILEVNARRLGSDLDSFLEVLDSKGNSIERAVVRPVWETNVTLRDHDSASIRRFTKYRSFRRARSHHPTACRSRLCTIAMTMAAPDMARIPCCTSPRPQMASISFAFGTCRGWAAKIIPTALPCGIRARTSGWR
jgi:hypothetical protein